MTIPVTEPLSLGIRHPDQNLAFSHLQLLDLGCISCNLIFLFLLISVRRLIPLTGCYVNINVSSTLLKTHRGTLSIFMTLFHRGLGRIDSFGNNTEKKSNPTLNRGTVISNFKEAKETHIMNSSSSKEEFYISMFGLSQSRFVSISNHVDIFLCVRCI